MSKQIIETLSSLKSLSDKIVVTNKSGHSLVVDKALESCVNMIHRLGDKKVIFIGNGASASIASHMATDFWKNGRTRATAFNDPALLTCVSNDYGYEHVFEKPIRMFSNSGDILIAISSSGASPNILKAVEAAEEMELSIISLSGFSSDNPLRGMGDVNFYVPSCSYGPIEVLHHALCHCIVDHLCRIKAGSQGQIAADLGNRNLHVIQKEDRKKIVRGKSLLDGEILGTKR